MRTSLAGALVLAVVLGAVTACGGDDAPAPRTIAVPGDAATIQAAVDEARPGDLVLVEPGTYREAVVVHTADVTLRGRDRNAVVIDGEFERNSGIVVTADGVAIENLTVVNHTDNGVLIASNYLDDAGAPEVQRYRVSYVTAANNGLYGIYAFDVRSGTIEHSYASGTAGAGFYVGQCKPCDVVLDDVVAEHNTLGYQGANASDVLVVQSVFRANRVGIVTLSETVEARAPQRGATFAANRVVDNASADAPAGVDPQFGLGIVSAGSVENLFTANVVSGHPSAGLLITGQGAFLPLRNAVRGNDLRGNGVDLAFRLAERDEVMGLSNCFAENTFATSIPEAIEVRVGCDAPDGAGPFATAPLPPVEPPPGLAYETVPRPGPQPNRPGDPAAAPTPVRAPARPDLATLVVPA